MKQSKIRKSQMRRKYHVRKKIYGTSERPRLSVFRSSRHIYVQIVDDSAGVTLASASTRANGLRGEVSGAGGNISSAEVIGTAIAKEAISVGINCVVFDRNRYKYHGRIKALADAARKSGLVF